MGVGVRGGKDGGWEQGLADERRVQFRLKMASERSE